jgi:hypothetical protein
MTVPKHTSNSPLCRNPIDMGKSTDNDGDDDELRTFSKGVAALFLNLLCMNYKRNREGLPRDGQCDDCVGRDDELQKFSKGDVPLS